MGSWSFRLADARGGPGADLQCLDATVPLRELLFGLLALQNGMIIRDQLVAAFSVWTAGDGRAMADILVEQGALRLSTARCSRPWPGALEAPRGQRREESGGARSQSIDARESVAHRRPGPGEHTRVRRTRPGYDRILRRRRRSHHELFGGRLEHVARPAVPRPPSPCPRRIGGGLRRAGHRAQSRGRTQADSRQARR